VPSGSQYEEATLLREARAFGLELLDEGNLVYVLMKNGDVFSQPIVFAAYEGDDSMVQWATYYTDCSGTSWRTADGWQYMTADEWDREFGGLMEFSKFVELVRAVARYLPG
jgi:hypothetical protein